MMTLNILFASPEVLRTIILKILNVVVALKIWAPSWANKSIEIMCDNMAVVEVLSSGRARDSIMATCARNVWLLAAMFNAISLSTISEVGITP